MDPLTICLPCSKSVPSVSLTILSRMHVRAFSFHHLSLMVTNGLLWSMLECGRLPVGYYGPCWNVTDCLWVIMVHVGMW